MRSKFNVTWLVIAAAEFELSPLRKVCGPSTHFATFGIGHLQAAREALRLRELATNKHVVYVGTCGRFSAFKDVELVSVDEVQWSCLGERLGLAYKIKDTLPSYQLKTHPQLSGPLSKVTALCAASISTDATLPKTYGDAAQYVENVELYSIAPIVSEKALSFTAILGVTNSLCVDAHQSWRQHYVHASQITAAFLETHLKG